MLSLLMDLGQVLKLQYASYSMKKNNKYIYFYVYIFTLKETCNISMTIWNFIWKVELNF